MRKIDIDVSDICEVIVCLNEVGYIDPDYDRVYLLKEKLNKLLVEYKEGTDQ